MVSVLEASYGQGHMSVVSGHGQLQALDMYKLVSPATFPAHVYLLVAINLTRNPPSYISGSIFKQSYMIHWIEFADSCISVIWAIGIPKYK